jgi:hypothetical protein
MNIKKELYNKFGISREREKKIIFGGGGVLG